MKLRVEAGTKKFGSRDHQLKVQLEELGNLLNETGVSINLTGDTPCLIGPKGGPAKVAKWLEEYGTGSLPKTEPAD